MKQLKSYRLSPATIAILGQLKKDLRDLYGTRWTETDIVEHAVYELMRTVERKTQETARGW